MSAALRRAAVTHGLHRLPVCALQRGLSSVAPAASPVPAAAAHASDPITDPAASATPARPLRTGGRVKKPKLAALADASTGGASAWAPIRGTHDCLPLLASRQRAVESVLSNLAAQYTYGELRTPQLERVELFSRSLGADSDVVSKEMFRFDDHGTHTVLRPEATRYWYTGPMFRRERPQAGRYRQFLQFGVELVGGGSTPGECVRAEAEVIQMADQAVRRLGLGRYVVLELNSLGDTASRAAYVSALTAFLQQHKAQLSEESQQRLERGTVLRILDSKDAGDQALLRGESSPSAGAASSAPPRPAAAAPLLRDYLSPACRDRFTSLQQSLTHAGVRFELNPFLVRGLDYYSHACFEFRIDLPRVQQRIEELHARGGGATPAGTKKPAVPAQSTVLAGGRYDGLFKTLGGPTVPAIGWAAGIDRLILLADLVQPGGQSVALTLPTPVGIVCDNAEEMQTEEGEDKDDIRAQEAAHTTQTDAAAIAAASATSSSSPDVTLDEAYAALCTYVRDGCALPAAASVGATAAAAQSYHAPRYSVVQSFSGSLWKQLRNVSRAAEGTAAASNGGQPPMPAVIVIGARDIAANKVQFRDQRTKQQTDIPLTQLARRLREAAGEVLDPSSSTDAAQPLTFADLRDAYRAD